MKINDYSVLCLVIFFGLFFSEMRSQEVIYSKIAVFVSEPSVPQQLVALGMAIDHYEHNKNNTISFYATQDELQTLRDLNIEFSVEIEDYSVFYKEQSISDKKNLTNMVRNSAVANGFDLGSMGGFYTYDEIMGKLDEMKNDYPNLITAKTSIGTSIEGRDIWMAKISDNPNTNEDEPVAYFDALHHAREPLSMATTINFMFWLLENYETDEQVKFLVDHREIYFVPVVNPDGYEYNRETDPDGGGFWRKNRNPNDGTCFGVDLNRNYSFAYANNNSCSSPDPCSGTYRGEGAFSEPETSAIRDFLAVIAPKTAFSTHSTSGSYLMPYGFDTSPPEFDIYSEWASIFLSENDYPYGVTFQMLGYTSCGTTRDYMHSEEIYGWTPEIDGAGFWPPQSTIFDLVGENVYPLFYNSWVAGAYVDVQSHKIIGDAMPGESFSLEVEAKNIGVGASAENVTVMVEASLSGIAISAPLNYGAIESRTRTSNENEPFTISLDADFEDIFFDLKISTFQDGVLNDVLEIPVFVGVKEVLYFDDAESGAANWTATGSGILWSEVSDDTYSGALCFGDSDGGNGMNNTLNFFELNLSFDLSGTISPILSFITKYSLEQGDFVDLQITVDEGNNWETLRSFELNEPWLPYFFTLHDYTDEASVRFRFMMDTDGSIPADGFYFDDFEISNYDSLIFSTNDLSNENEIAVYPNPFTAEISIESIDTVMADLFDLHGRKINVEVKKGNGITIISNLEVISKGVYFLKIVGNNNGITKIHKMIKQ
jgi:carboxypeptidase T